MKNNLYTSFNPNWVVDIISSSEIGDHALEGTYQATADENTGKRIVSALKNYGIVANYRYLGNSVYISEFFFILFQYRLFLLFYAMLVALLFAQCYSIAFRNKEQVAMVTNFSSKKIFLRTLKTHVKYFLLCAIISLPIILFFLYFYNHWHL